MFFRSNRNIRQVPIPTATEPERETQDPPESEKEHLGDVDVPEQQSLASSGVFLSCPVTQFPQTLFVSLTEAAMAAAAEGSEVLPGQQPATESEAPKS